MPTIRHALKALFREKRSLATVVIIVGLGVGMNAALFSVFDGLLFRPLPYPNADRVVHLDAPLHVFQPLPAEARRTAERIAATALLVDRCDVKVESVFQEGSEAVVEWHLKAALISSQFFPLLGVQPVLGRPFVEADAAASPRPLVLSDQIWRRRFAADPTVINRIITIPGTPDDEPWVVVGVMPQRFDFPAGSNLWVPYDERTSVKSLSPDFARLTPRASIEALRAELPGVVIKPLREYLRPDRPLALGLLLGATSLLLLLAWVHAAALLFSRAAGRAGEIGVRLALGAGRRQVALELIAEGGWLATGALGLASLVTMPFVSLIEMLLPIDIVTGHVLQPGVRTIVYCSAVAIGGFALCSALPADVVRRSVPAELLRGNPFGRVRLRATRVRTSLFVSQVAITTVLLYAAGIAFQSFRRITTVDLGFEPRNLVAVPIPQATRPRGARPEAARLAELRNQDLAQQAITDIRRLTGVRGATFATAWPMIRGGRPIAMTPALAPDEHVNVLTTSISIGYAAVIGARLIQGREPTPEETSGTVGPLGLSRVALVNETLARRLERYGPAIGQTLSPTKSLSYHVIGVLRDIKQERIDVEVEPMLYTYIPSYTYAPIVLIRVTTTDASLPALRETIDLLWGVGRGPRGIVLLESVAHDATIEYWARTRMLGLVVLLCLPITIIGVAGAVSYAADVRTHVWGIELALGATPARVRLQVLSGAIAMTAVGVSVGLAIAIEAASTMRSYLFGVGLLDVQTVVGTTIAMVAVSALGAIGPANRAARISPARALRES